MPEPDVLLSIVRVLGAHAPAFYCAGLAGVMLLAMAAWLGSRRLAGQHLQGRPPRPAWLFIRAAVGLAAIVLAATVFAEIAEHIGPNGRIARADELLAATLRADLGPTVLRLFAAFTHPGDTIVLSVLGFSVAVALARAGHRSLMVGWLMAVIGNALLNTMLKRIFERVRPVHDHGYASESGWSFPSGHSSGAMVAYGMLAYLALRLLAPRWHLPALLAAAALIFTTGCSRIVLQVHFASDVLAGFTSGFAWLAVCVFSLEWHKRRGSHTGIGPARVGNEQ